MEYLFYYMPQTPNKIWKDKGLQNTANFGQNTSFFCKNWTKTYLTTTHSKTFNIIFVDIFFWNHWLMKSSIRIRIFLIWNSQLIFFSVNCIRKKQKCYSDWLTARKLNVAQFSNVHFLLSKFLFYFWKYLKNLQVYILV